MSRPFILVGNYGAGNIGDDALAEYFQSAFRDEQMTMVSSSPLLGALPRFPFGLRSLFRPWWRTIFAIRRSRGVIFGGGTLFTDTESLRACIMWWMYFAVARFFSRPVFLAFQGVGPFRTRLAERIARSVFSSAVFISVRDERSLERMRTWDLRSSPVLTFDPAFIRFHESQKSTSNEKVLTLIPRHTSGESFIHASLQALGDQSWDRLRIILMDPSPLEHSFAKRLRALPLLSGATVIPVGSVTEFLERMSDATFVIAERFHGLLAATALRIPFRVVSTHPGDKFSTLTRYADPSSSDISGLLTLVQTGERALKQACIDHAK